MKNIMKLIILVVLIVGIFCGASFAFFGTKVFVQDRAISVVRHITYVYDESTQICYAVSYAQNPTQTKMFTVVPNITEEVSKRMISIQTCGGK